MYQSMNQCHDPPCTTNVPQGDDVYNVPDIISSHTVETKSGTHETVYSEPIQPSLFMDALQNLMDSEYLQPYTHQSCKQLCCMQCWAHNSEQLAIVSNI